jgi:hypothetical protein
VLTKRFLKKKKNRFIEGGVGTAITAPPARHPGYYTPPRAAPNTSPAPMNNQQEAFRRFAQQLQRASQGGGGFPGGTPRGLFAGGGLIVALVAGGLALNASLFNGTHRPSFH